MSAHVAVLGFGVIPVICCPTASALGPDSLIIPIPARPVAVAIAQMVSASCLTMSLILPVFGATDRCDLNLAGKLSNS